MYVITWKWLRSIYDEILRKSGRIFSGEPGVLSPWLLCRCRSATNWHLKVTRVMTDPARLKPVWFRLSRVKLLSMKCCAKVAEYYL